MMLSNKQRVRVFFPPNAFDLYSLSVVINFMKRAARRPPLYVCDKLCEFHKMCKYTNFVQCTDLLSFHKITHMHIRTHTHTQHIDTALTILHARLPELIFVYLE